MKMEYKCKKCNYCQNILTEGRKYYCEQCEEHMFRECKRCHKPYHLAKYYTIAETCCNSCASKKKRKHCHVEDIGKSLKSNGNNHEDIENFNSESSSGLEEVKTKMSRTSNREEQVEEEQEAALEETSFSEEEEVSPCTVQFQESDEHDSEESVEAAETDEEDINVLKAPKKQKKEKKVEKKIFNKKELNFLNQFSGTQQVKQQRKKKAKDGKNLEENTKTLTDILQQSQNKKGPKPGAKRKSVDENERNRKNFVNAIIQLKKTDPEFSFNGNFEWSKNK